MSQTKEKMSEKDYVRPRIKKAGLPDVARFQALKRALTYQRGVDYSAEMTYEEAIRVGLSQLEKELNINQ